MQIEGPITCLDSAPARRQSQAHRPSGLPCLGRGQAPLAQLLDRTKSTMSGSRLANVE